MLFLFPNDFNLMSLALDYSFFKTLGYAYILDNEYVHYCAYRIKRKFLWLS